MNRVQSPQANLGLFDMRVYVRKLRNVLAVVLMVAIYLQTFGIPSLSLSPDQPVIRLVHLKRPVWSYGWSATVFLWSQFTKENKP